MLSADCEVCCIKTLRFIKGQEARGLLLGPNYLINFLKNVPLLCTIFERYKIKKVINKLLLAGDKFMFEIHLRQPGLLTVLERKK